MKYRSDFVTNSSSSSFIGVFAKLNNVKAEATIEELKLEKFVKTGQEILEEMAHKYFWGYGCDWADITPHKEDIEKESKYLVWESYGGVDEEELILRDENGEFDGYDYSVYITDFMDEEQDIYSKITEENGFIDIDKGYGAGFDG